ncbi:MAG: flagellar hook-associated protein FlgL [Aquabacterium sp.]|jgi:flagellar hook-associated protein 3 FlgL|uniref:flagellar hook-associated protein FlgL n=1 Tax=Aquabacterium sp. TaxID=1872578 RepID=UPI002A371530|nr:flagellar hook-associated protein FlgL [Aquabacterium sp.]MDX9844755.1 flagellar hook-associated protein FlgL [Aquabacterium sp.]
MRIATAFRYEQSISNLQQRQQDLSTAQMQLTSGKRVNAASDDPTAAARAERALASIARTDADQRAVDASKNAMAIAESVLGDAVELMQSARETIVAAGNGAYSSSDRQALAAKLTEIRKQLLSVANRPDGGGGYVFGGQGATQVPFIESSATVPSTVVFQGQPGQIEAASTEKVNLTLDGQRIWMFGREQDGTLSPVNVFDALATAVERLNDPSITGTDAQTTVNNGLGDLDKILGNVQSARSEVGEMLNRMDGIESRLADSKLAAQTEKSNAEDLDMVDAISQFQNKQTGYEAALQSYASIQKMSLFQYIN